LISGEFTSLEILGFGRNSTYISAIYHCEIIPGLMDFEIKDSTEKITEHFESQTMPV